jgi:hypothetical protein
VSVSVVKIDGNLTKISSARSFSNGKSNSADDECQNTVVRKQHKTQTQFAEEELTVKAVCQTSAS